MNTLELSILFMLLGVEDPISGDELEMDQNVTYSQILTGSQIVSADVS